jgi:DNA-binding NarL/FixJ family response regulator
MIVDDDPIILSILGNGLQKSGYRVSAYESPFEALESYKTHPPDIAIVDIEMPGMDGIELTDKMLGTVYRPILVLSSTSDTDVTNAAIRSGVIGYHVKPVAPAQIIPAIRTAVGRFSGLNDSLIGQFLGREDAEKEISIQSVLDQFAFGVLILDHDWTLLQINKVGRTILDCCELVGCEAGKLSSTDKEFMKLVKKVLDDAFAAEDSAELFGAAMPSREGVPQFQILAVPIGDVRPALNVLLMVIDPSRGDSGNSHVLRAVYHLTEKESAVAEALVRGWTLDEYCERSHVSKHTARSQLKAVYRKTNTSSQVGLVALLSNLLVSFGSRSSGPAPT